MHRIGIDVGSTYTKYCVMSEEGMILQLYAEKTPVRQKDYFNQVIESLKKEHGNATIVSCGYGKSNIVGINQISELVALARGTFLMGNDTGMILDVGGQDTKILFQEKGKLKKFFINDKCAAGSGLFLSNVLKMLNLEFSELNLRHLKNGDIQLSSTCAVFAQSDIVKLIADNRNEEEIILAVVEQIFRKSIPLVNKMGAESVLLSGGISQIPGIEDVAENVMQITCKSLNKGAYLAAIGCASFTI